MLIIVGNVFYLFVTFWSFVIIGDQYLADSTVHPPALDRGLTGGSQERGILILAQQGGSLATKLK